jgi:chromosomal replication initiation ATPase DnaA
MKTQSPYVAPGQEPVIQEPLDKVIADTFGVERELLVVPFTRTRKKVACNPRFFYMYFVSRLKNYGPSATGNIVGRGHADVIYACTQCSNYIDTEKDYRSKAHSILRQIEQGRVILPEFCQS